MSVLLSQNNNELFLNCQCGCDDGIHIKIKPFGDDYAYITYTNGNFYRDQHGAFSTLIRKLKKIWSIIYNKDYAYSEIVMSQEDFEVFKQYINSIK